MSHDFGYIREGVNDRERTRLQAIFPTCVCGDVAVICFYCLRADSCIVASLAQLAHGDFPGSVHKRREERRSGAVHCFQLMSPSIFSLGGAARHRLIPHTLHD
jgi:hypothetical protein